MNQWKKYGAILNTPKHNLIVEEYQKIKLQFYKRSDEHRQEYDERV